MTWPNLCTSDRLRPVLCEEAGLKEKKPLWEENDGGQIPGSGNGECESLVEPRDT